MYALVDCNNFYVSCERLFQPHLIGKPVVVLSNNDGCVIARSDEAKAVGVEMGTPAYMCEGLFKEHNIKIFSSNYTLYGDMSDRVMKTLKNFAPEMEIYSIDECFLDFSALQYSDLHKLAVKIRATIIKDIGIPVSVGVAASRTLAKMANRYAKKRYKQLGVYSADTDIALSDMLTNTMVGDICGVGKSYALLLQNAGAKTAMDVTKLPAEFMRVNMSVVGLRLWHELQGKPCIEWEFEPKKKENICTSRSFSKMTNDYSIVQEAVSNHAATCARKLRAQNSVCKDVHVFIQTNPHKAELKQYFHSITFECETPTNLTKEIIAYALKGLEIIFLPKDYFYMKCGVMVLNIIPDNVIQASLFDNQDRVKDKKISKVVDLLNRNMGDGTVRMAVQRFDKRYKLRADHLSKKFTTNINDIVKIKK